MSQDFLLASYCPHEIIQEKVTSINSDRRTITLKNSVEDKTSVKIYFNGELIPPHGKELPATIESFNSSPFKLSSGNMVFSKYKLIKDPIPTTFSVSIPQGYYSAVDLAQKINSHKDNTFIKANNNQGFLTLQDSSGHFGSASIISVSSPLLDVLGLSSSITQGKVLFPGWTVSLMGSQLPSFITFKAPISANPEIKVSYRTYANVCMRCMSSGVENDLTFNTYGEPVLITDENLLFQACMKVLLTKGGSNPYHTWYGANLDKFLGQKALNSVIPFIKEEIRKALEKLQGVQQQQKMSQNVTSGESFYRISSIDVSINPENPQIFNIDVTVINNNTEPVNITILYTNSSVASGF
jgi:hypothetical protein